MPLRRARTASWCSTPWQSRVFGLCAAVAETCFDGDREPFRRQLIAAIEADPHRPYWDSWTVALERLVVAAAVVDAASIDGHAAADVP